MNLEKPCINELPQIKERLSFLYLERSVINRAENAITVNDSRGTAYIPAGAISVLMLGPGTKITHRAMELIGDCGVTVIWTGENGVRYYAHGKPLTHSSQLLIAQVSLVSNIRTRALVVRNMYTMRFPDEDISELTIQQLRGREGVRIRNVYRTASEKTGVPWHGREYDPDNYENSDPINQALSAAHACLYGLAHSVIVAMGCSPALGFVHTGHERSFVYDIADLYKAEVTIPIAFEITSKLSNLPNSDIGSETRRAVRDAISDGRILERCARDIRNLLLSNNSGDETNFKVDVLELWDDKAGSVKSGVSYARYYDVLFNPDVEDIEEIGNGAIFDDCDSP